MENFDEKEVFDLIFKLMEQEGVNEFAIEGDFLPVDKENVISNLIVEMMEKEGLKDFVVEAAFIPAGSENNPNNSLSEYALQQGGILFTYKIDKEKVKKYVEEKAVATDVGITDSEKELSLKE